MASSPDEVRIFEKGMIEIVNFENGITIGRGTLEPGWSWERCVKPIVKTDNSVFVENIKISSKILDALHYYQLILFC